MARASPLVASRARWLLAALLLCASALLELLPRVASAAPPSATPDAPPPLSAPRALSMPRVPYPDGAEGDAVVVLELAIDVAGAVTSAKSVDGKEPFASAATAASRAWTFEPARRGDVAVAAKIRVRVEFTAPRLVPDGVETDGGAPLATEAGAPPEAVAATSGSGGGGAAVMEQVEVTALRKEVGQTTLGGGEVRQIPGAFGDAFRAMEAMPGVTPILSGLPFFYVRGAPPGNVGYFLDGVRVPLLFHLGLGPSVVHPGMVDHVDFYPGGFPARFGRFAGGILSGETRQPATELHAEGNVRLIDAGALVESPVGQNVTVLAAGRYSYTALLLTAAAAITGNKVRLDYWDYQSRVAWRATKDDTLSVFAFGSFDYLGAESDGQFKDLFSTQFHRLDLRWDHKIPDGHMRLAATLGLDTTRAAGTVGVRDKVMGTRFEMEKKLSSEVLFRAGSDAWLDVNDTSSLDNGNGSSSAPSSGAAGNLPSTPGQSNNGSIIPPRNDVAMGVWFDFVYRPHPRVELIPGARFDYFGSSQQTGAVAGQSATTLFAGGGAGQPAFDPRLATRIRIHPRVTSVEQVAVSHQPPSFIIPVPGLALGQLRTGLQSSYTLSQGFEIDLPQALTLTPTVFNQSYLGLTDLATSCQRGAGADTCLDERVRGRTVGLEVLLRRGLTKRLTGWIAYTLSRTTRDTNATQDLLDLSKVGGTTDVGAALRAGQLRGHTGTILGEYDRTHVLNVIGAYDLGRGIRAGARFVYYTGTPYSQKIGGIDIPPYNNQRLPDFFRFDVRLEKRWNLRGTAWVSVVLEWMNVSFQKEAAGVSCKNVDGQLIDQCGPSLIGPITIPSLGLEGAL